MKRVIREASAVETFSIKVDIFHEMQDDIVSTDILPISEGKNLLDADALVDYNCFLENVWETLDYYGFQILRSKESKSFPYTSKYAWIAYASEIEKKDVPLMVKMRISDHPQKVSPEYRDELKHRDRAEADELKMPEGKKKQRFIIVDIVVNNHRYATYEEALAAIDRMIYEWLDKLNIDVSDIVPLWH